MKKREHIFYRSKKKLHITISIAGECRVMLKTQHSAEMYTLFTILSLTDINTYTSLNIKTQFSSKVLTHTLTEKP